VPALNADTAATKICSRLERRLIGGINSALITAKAYRCTASLIIRQKELLAASPAPSPDHINVECCSGCSGLIN
jgi:hypothetical protein